MEQINTDIEKLSLAMKVAQKTIGFNIKPIKLEDCSKEIAKIVNRGLQKMFKEQKVTCNVDLEPTGINAVFKSEIDGETVYECNR